ncbi:hypothetical protein [Lentzea sp. NPDC004782]|uniref:hypothetical protein n=1 Tax=Lentzea sp. NPDC004782 TaxID=3154458 RepID=UPI0033A97BF5
MFLLDRHRRLHRERHRGVSGSDDADRPTNVKLVVRAFEALPTSTAGHVTLVSIQTVLDGKA